MGTPDTPQTSKKFKMVYYQKYDSNTIPPAASALSGVYWVSATKSGNTKMLNLTSEGADLSWNITGLPVSKLDNKTLVVETNGVPLYFQRAGVELEESLDEIARALNA